MRLKIAHADRYLWPMVAFKRWYIRVHLMFLSFVVISVCLFVSVGVFFIPVNYHHILQRLFQSIAVNIVSSSFKCLRWIFHIHSVAHKFNRNKYNMHSAHARLLTDKTLLAQKPASIPSKKKKKNIGKCMNYWRQLRCMKSTEQK